MNFLQIFDWYQFKLLVEHSTGVSMDALHILVGVLIQQVVAVALTSSVARWRPLLAVLALVLVNEVNDFLVDVWPDMGMQLGEALKDVVPDDVRPDLDLPHRPPLAAAACSGFKLAAERQQGFVVS